MADLDQAVVISVVYDGPPEAGKTTSVRTLARSFGREVYTPEERNGRTVFYDWLEHTGGRFEGAPIHCQIVTVPGQKRWTRRRGHFLDRADVVVFVGDTTARAWPETVARLSDLRARLDARPGPPVGLVFQANKRDCADAVPSDEIKARAASARTAVVESIAHDGTGVREAFVFAVRLALDRLREERPGRAPLGRAGFGQTHGNELLDMLRRLDPDHPEPEPEPGPAAPAPGAAPRPPSHDAPSGFVWPPIEGRIVLREAAPAAERARVTAAGDCVAGLGGDWLVHSSAAAVFDDLDAGRTALVAWARQHVAAQAVLSRRRCIVLAEAGAGQWRLWQIVRREPSLRELELPDGERRLAEAAAACREASLALPCTLDTIGLTEHARPIFVALMPPGARAPEAG